MIISIFKRYRCDISIIYRDTHTVRVCKPLVYLN